MNEFEQKSRHKNGSKFKLQKFSNDQLDQTLKAAVLKEREILAFVLEHIAEVDRRKLYLNFAYPSLFDYLTKHIGYSAGSAHRRIDAARLSNEVPELLTRLEVGSLNLAQVSLLQKSARRSLTEKKQKVSPQTKKQLLDDLEGKSLNESQILISRTLDIQIKELPKVTHQQNESVRLEVTLTKQQWQKLNYMRELLSSSLPHGSESWDQVFEFVCDKVIAQKAPKKNSEPEFSKEHSSEFQKRQLDTKPSADIEALVVTETEITPEYQIINPRQNHVRPQSFRIPLTKKIRDHVLNRDQCCQFKSIHTNKICGSKWRLHVDHIQPMWAGGKNELRNLRILCARHNLELYRSQSATRSF